MNRKKAFWATLGFVILLSLPFVGTYVGSKYIEFRCTLSPISCNYEKDRDIDNGAAVMYALVAFFMGLYCIGKALNVRIE